MWYWGQRGREKVGRVIVRRRRQHDGARAAGLGDAPRPLAEAIAMGRSTMGRSAQITMLHHPPILITDVM